MELTHTEGRDLVVGQARALLGAVEGLDDRQLLAPSRCFGWAVADLLVHVHLGLQEMLLAFTCGTDEPPTVDAATYWAIEPPSNDEGADEADRTAYVRRIASSYRRPTSLIGHLTPTVHGLVRAAEQLPPGRIAFQDQVLTSGDFLGSWATELAVHHLDMTAELTVPAPDPGALRLARSTVEELAEAAMPSEWDDETAALIGWGRAPMTPAQRRQAGSLADRLPLLT